MALVADWEPVGGVPVRASGDGARKTLVTQMLRDQSREQSGTLAKLAHSYHKASEILASGHFQRVPALIPTASADDGQLH